MRTLLSRFLDLVRRPFRREPWVTSAVHCVNCGHAYVAVIPASDPAYNAELGIFDMLECPQCGLYLVCSD
jgi:hypothetical protein